MYPTIQCKSTKKIHIVKDKHYSECGERFNWFYNQTRRDLRDIKFRESKDITCEACKLHFISSNGVTLHAQLVQNTEYVREQKQPL